MGITLLIIFICIAIGLILFIIGNQFKLELIPDIGIILSGISSILFIILSIIFNVIYNVSEPTALDVYRGKTELQITYNDDNTLDSVVVFKTKPNYEH